MDLYNKQPLGAVAQHKVALTEETPRPPLVPSEKNNAVPATRKPRTREITSRYKSGITSTPLSTPSAPRRCPSPNVSRTSPTPGASLPKRAQSAERRRPATPSRPSTPSSPSSRSTTPVCDLVKEVQNSSRRLLSDRTPDGLWPSMRSLSASFQSESITVPVSKRDRVVTNSLPDHPLKSSANAVSERKRTPLRGRNTSDHSENSRPVENSHARVVDQHRWPGMMGRKVSANALSRSMDLTDKVNRSATLPVSTRGISPPRRMPLSDGASRGLQKLTSDVTRQIDGSGRVEREMRSSIIVSSNLSEKAPSITRPSRTQSLPIPALQRPSSPNKVSSTLSSTSRSMQSPTRTRPSSPFSSSTSATSRAGISSSVLNYISDVRKGKKSANHIECAHQLRLLYNWGLQWRFVNAWADSVLYIQKITTENILHSVWNTTSELCDSVIEKRVNMQQLRQQMKLDLILKEQMVYLEDWAALEREHSSSLSGAFEALKASTVRLPVTRGARADVHAVKNAVSSAVDVMQAMGSSICYLLSRVLTMTRELEVYILQVEGTNCLVSELTVVAAKERAMLDECRELLASTTAMQVQESSLRTHLIQLRQDVHKDGVANHCS